MHCSMQCMFFPSSGKKTCYFVFPLHLDVDLKPAVQMILLLQTLQYNMQGYGERCHLVVRSLTKKCSPLWQLLFKVRIKDLLKHLQ